MTNIALWAPVALSLPSVALALWLSGSFLLSVVRDQLRFRRFRTKYGDDIADQMVKQRPWRGMTSEQVVEVFGPPLAIEDRIDSQGLIRIFKYHRVRGEGYIIRIQIQADQVIAYTLPGASGVRLKGR